MTSMNNDSSGTGSIMAKPVGRGERRLYLSPPHQSGGELAAVTAALASNWLAPAGPDIEAFENEFADLVGAPAAVAVASGTAAIHLALRMAGVGPGDRVLCSTFTFVASANPIRYLGADPVFIDSEESSWNLDPDLLEEALQHFRRSGPMPKALVLVHLYGQCADTARIARICDEYGVVLIEDAAESLGATCAGRPSGAFGVASAFSFNGNKILTTGGGGMITMRDRAWAHQVRFLSTQARDRAPWYQHSQLGYNYRLSNILASIGRAQLPVLEQRINARRANFAAYVAGLGDIPGVSFMPEAPWGRSTRWLSCLVIDPQRFPKHRPESICEALEQRNIEVRALWKPLHLQPLFGGCQAFGGAVSERLFATGLCLPSGSALADADRSRVISALREILGV